jgi:hypothetical protein
LKWNQPRKQTSAKQKKILRQSNVAKPKAQTNSKQSLKLQITSYLTSKENNRMSKQQKKIHDIKTGQARAELCQAQFYTAWCQLWDAYWA